SIIEPGNVATPIWEKSKASVEIREAKLPEVARQIYGRQMAAVRRFAEKAAGVGIDADVVAQTVAHALLATRPKTRYLVGRDAKGRAALARAFPERRRDVFVRRRLVLRETIKISASAPSSTDRTTTPPIANKIATTLRTIMFNSRLAKETQSSCRT